MARAAYSKHSNKTKRENKNKTNKKEVMPKHQKNNCFKVTKREQKTKTKHAYIKKYVYF